MLNSPRRIHSGHQSPSLFNRRYAFSLVALLAALAFGLLFLLPIGPLQAQNADAIEYPENSMDEVATFTADDPEDRPVYWSLATEAVTDEVADGDFEDSSHFSISADGVLSFRFSPDYEMPRGEAKTDENTNTYNVVVVASDNPTGAGTSVMPIMMGYEKVTVDVIDMDEPGAITLSAQQPQIGVALTATLTDDDAVSDQIDDAKWKWEHSDSKAGPWTAILTTTSTEYTPLGVEDKYLRVTATYDDEHGDDKPIMAVSAHAVRAAPPNNASPVFSDEDGDTEDTQVSRKVDENSPPGTNVGKPVVANDAAGDVLTYTLADDGDNDNYRIDQATGQISVGPRTTLNREGPNESDEVTVTATDPWGTGATPSGATTQEVTITINNVNEVPMVTAGVTTLKLAEYDADTPTADAGDETTRAKTVSTYTGSDVDQDLTAVPLTWSVSGTDAGDFEISNETATLGQLTFEEAPNYEMPADSNGDNVYMVTVIATDAGVNDKNKMTAERAVVITVTNVEEDGTVTLSSVQPKIGFPLTASETDPDGGVMDTTWKWERDNTGTAGTPTNCSTTIADEAWEDAVDGMGAKTDTYTPDAKDEGKCLRATASYTDGKGMDDAMAVSNNAVIMDQANQPPRFRVGGVDSDADTAANTGDTAMSAERSIAENVTPDTAGDPNPANVGMPVLAFDPNGDTLTYRLSGNDAGSFDIDPATGQISAKMKLDREAKSSHMVTVTATDPNGASASVGVTIKVTNVDEAPEIAGDDVTTDYRENGTAQVARFTAEDPEDRMVYWSVLADDAAFGGIEDVDTADAADEDHFTISASGVLSFRFSPDYEMPMGGAADTNTYKVVVVASDDPTGAGTDGQGAGIMMGYKKVTVNVTDLEETETVTLSAQQGQVGVGLTATYNDLDNEKPAATTITWKWFLGGSQISGADSLTYDAPANPGTHRVEASYTKSDGSKKAVSATISVRAEPSAGNAAPVFPSGSNARSVDENSPPGTKVGKPVTANDTGGDRLHYTLTGAVGSSFDINPATGQITVAARITLDADEGTPTRIVTVTATDPWGTGATPSGATTQEVTITINNVNEVPMVTAGVTTLKLAEYDADTPTADAGDETTRAKTVSTYTGSDVDQDLTAVPLTWSVSGTDAGDFEISNETATLGQLTFEEAPNYEMPADSNGDNVYMVTVIATDAGVNDKNKMTAERAVVITVTNVEEDGTVTLSSVQPKIGFPLTASETDPDGGVMDTTWKWERDNTGTAGTPTNCSTTIADEAWEDAVDGMGAKTDTYTPDAKDEGKCLRATASYTDGKGMDDAMAVSNNAVIMDQANQPPRFRVGGVDSDADTAANTGDTAMSAERSIAENVTPDTAGDPNPANVGMPVLAFDPNGDTLTYRLSGNDAGSFDIDPATGQISAKMKLDREAKSSHMVTVTATDPNGASASVGVTIKVTNVDEAPEIMVGGLGISGMSSVQRDEAPSTAVATYTAVGPESASARWSLSGTDAGDFRISSSGVLTFRSMPDYEMPMDMDMDNVYEVVIEATDSESNTAMRAVTVTVINVDEDGTVTLSSTAPAVDTALTASVTDPDGVVTGTTTWQWARSSDGLTGWANIPGAMSASYTPVDPDDVGKYLRAMASYTDGYSSGRSKDAITASAVAAEGTAEDPLLTEYDPNSDGMIEKVDMRRAVANFFGSSPTLDRADMRRLVGIFFRQ